MGMWGAGGPQGIASAGPGKAGGGRQVTGLVKMTHRISWGAKVGALGTRAVSVVIRLWNRHGPRPQWPRDMHGAGWARRARDAQARAADGRAVPGAGRSVGGHTYRANKNEVQHCTSNQVKEVAWKQEL